MPRTAHMGYCHGYRSPGIFGEESKLGFYEGRGLLEGGTTCD